MQRSTALRTSLVCLALFAGLAEDAKAKKVELVLNSTPQGARIEFKGNTIGTTPYRVSYPKNYFDGPRTIWSKYLNESVVVTLYKKGYQTKTVELTHGPLLWRSFNGTNTFYYYTLDYRYNIMLNPIPALPSTPSATHTSEPVEAFGTAFHVLRAGLLATNLHVVEDTLELELLGKGACPATVIASDRANDLALLKPDEECREALGLAQPLTLGASSQLSAGEDVVTFGYPLSTEFANEPHVSSGIVKSLTGLDGDLRTLTISNSIQPGNSGGPLFGPDGSVVGIVTSTMNVNYLYPRYKTVPQELNFAVKAEYLDLLFRLKGLDSEAEREVALSDESDTPQTERPTPADLPLFLKSIRQNVVLVRVVKAPSDE